jgi:8-oxo-dGTP pyrophosphatase MutT (NUDIX family)
MAARGGRQQIPRPSSVRPGPPAPWAELSEQARRPSLDEVRRALAVAPPPLLTDREHQPEQASPASAVLAALYELEGEAVVVLTRRAQNMRSHRGEVSFPGGRQDPGEDLWTTALREAKEEVDLDPATVTHLAELDHLRTVTSQSFIVPYVATLPGPPELVAAPHEVELVLRVPLRELLSDGVYRQERWGIPPQDRPIHFFDLVGDTIWGATAAMLHNLLALVTGTYDRSDSPVRWAEPSTSWTPPDRS